MSDSGHTSLVKRILVEKKDFQDYASSSPQEAFWLGLILIVCFLASSCGVLFGVYVKALLLPTLIEKQQNAQAEITKLEKEIDRLQSKDEFTKLRLDKFSELALREFPDKPESERLDLLAAKVEEVLARMSPRAITQEGQKLMLDLFRPLEGKSFSLGSVYGSPESQNFAIAIGEVLAQAGLTHPDPATMPLGMKVERGMVLHGIRITPRQTLTMQEAEIFDSAAKILGVRMQLMDVSASQSVDYMIVVLQKEGS